MSSVAEIAKSKKADEDSDAIMTPDGYARVRLGMKLHPKQAAVLRDLFKPKSRVVSRNANETGKTRRVLTAAILYAIEILGARVVSTAAVGRQLTEQLVPSLKGYAHLYDPKLWQFQDGGIKRYDSKNRTWIDAYTCVAAKDEDYFQGYHRDDNQPLFIAVDESQGALDTILNAAEHRCNPDYFLMTGSPGDPQGGFYDAETSKAKYYTHHKMSRFECLKEDGWWLDRADIDRMIEMHGEGNPFIQSTVYGEFSQTVEGALISLREYDRCVDSPPVWSRGDRHAFCDFAAGRDKNVLAVRVGNKVWIERKWVERDTMSAIGQFISMFVKLKKEWGFQDYEISGDADGLGLPMLQRIREVGWNINEFHGGSSPRFNDGYRNAVGECWGEGIQKIKNCAVVLPTDLDLKAQCFGRKAKHNSSGKLELESKEDMKKRGLSSPDEADACLCALMPAPQLNSTSLVELTSEYSSGQRDADEDIEKQHGTRRFFT